MKNLLIIATLILISSVCLAQTEITVCYEKYPYFLNVIAINSDAEHLDQEKSKRLASDFARTFKDAPDSVLICYHTILIKAHEDQDPSTLPHVKNRLTVFAAVLAEMPVPTTAIRDKAQASVQIRRNGLGL